MKKLFELKNKKFDSVTLQKCKIIGTVTSTARIFMATLGIAAATWFGTGKQAVAFNSDILFEAESHYQTVYVTRQDNTLTLRTGSRLNRSSSMDTTQPYRHVFEYTGLMMLGLAYLDEPKNALVIGLGGGTVPKYLKKYYSDMDIVSVEMDPVVVEVAEKFFDFSGSPSNSLPTWSFA